MYTVLIKEDSKQFIYNRTDCTASIAIKKV
ncbi:hypothetical protein SAMN06297358_0148 [Pedobacter xixiisoli]|uniref:Uncharacterized protein n=1 Tax=Pedobacter xixiisoli TaxID=1476464 RepID=A0A285ZP46_9SPHI|nr:hypothetical protein SAMN06297358_0148 [Pedobacter xixiisoli]